MPESAPVEQNSGSQAAEAGQAPAGGLTQQLVEEVAAKVYQMLLADLKIERERRRIGTALFKRGSKQWKQE